MKSHLILSFATGLLLSSNCVADSLGWELLPSPSAAPSQSVWGAAFDTGTLFFKTMLPSSEVQQPMSLATQLEFEKIEHQRNLLGQIISYPSATEGPQISWWRSLAKSAASALGTGYAVDNHPGLLIGSAAGLGAGVIAAPLAGFGLISAGTAVVATSAAANLAPTVAQWIPGAEGVAKRYGFDLMRAAGFR